MAERESETSGSAQGDRGAVRRRLSDRIAGPIDALNIIREVDSEKADAALESLASGDPVEVEILEELREAPSLADSGNFMHAHRTFVRAIEVYNRNARRSPKGLPAGIFRPIVTPVVTLMVTSIAHAYQRRVVREVRQLYALREANSIVGHPRHRMLTVARRQIDQISPDLSGRGFAIPAFLLGGAAISTIASFLQRLLHSDLGRFALLAAVLLVTVGAFWCIVMAAAVTRRRTHLVLDLPLQSLWTAIGSAGRPPREPSRVFVVVATLLLVLGWVIAPVVATILFRLA